MKKMYKNRPRIYHQDSLGYPESLPVTEKKQDIVNAISNNQVVIITGETGSGKSTQLPKMCLEANQGRKGMIGITQPRRIAAVSLAKRVAEELGPWHKGIVGCKIRFRDNTSPSTVIKFMTDGILLAEMQKDRKLNAYDTIIIDEAHERSVNIDFLMGILRGLIKTRNDLKVIITSATINTQKISAAFEDAPVISVTGRTYPVDIIYKPLNSEKEEAGDITYIDQTIDTVVELEQSRKKGDILIFMPTEADIRETVQRLEGSMNNCIILPLFGRLSTADQQKIFSNFPRRKVVVATNVAETSITVPGITYVIDTGLARIAEYNPQARTSGLAIKPVSKSSAEQRKGRCGRVKSGICIRLYSEDDLLNRPDFTQPEIMRSNLAEVILRMLFLKLGNVETFPFIDPPSLRSIKEGFKLLKELDALDTEGRLTKTGRIMARLPLDPRISRMLIQARKEKAVREIIVIAAGLSIQDPRERPAEKEGQADQAHARFKSPGSDFLTLMKIWEVYERFLKTSPTQNQRRKFCRQNFLSFSRMREWREIYDQICLVLKENKNFKINTQTASYEAVHKSVLSGFLSYIAIKKETNIYQGAHNKKLMLFPGSVIFKKGGDWIVSAEQVKTSKLFARIAASIEPEWIEPIAHNVCVYQYSAPHWEKKRGQVVALEKVLVFGLVIEAQRKIDYSKINLKEAREIFIRSALVQGDVQSPFSFLLYNQKVIKEIQSIEAKTRRRDLLVDEETIFEFYDKRIGDICDIRTFGNMLKKKGDDSFLRMDKNDLMLKTPDMDSLTQFPRTMRVGGNELPLSYLFEPNNEKDGVTLRVPVEFIGQIPAEPFEWLVPGLVKEKINFLFKGLPKAYRKQLVPLSRAASLVFDELTPYKEPFLQALERVVMSRFGILVSRDVWPIDKLPEHLVMRFEVIDKDGRILASSRDFKDLIKKAKQTVSDAIWTEATQKWEVSGRTKWDFKDLPQSIRLDSGPGVPRLAFPAIIDENGTIGVRLFREKKDADAANKQGFVRLVELYFKDQVKWLKKKWVMPDKEFIYLDFNIADIRVQIIRYILRQVFNAPASGPPLKDIFLKKTNELKTCLKDAADEIFFLITDTLKEGRITIEHLLELKKKAGTNLFLQEMFENFIKDTKKYFPMDFPDKYTINMLENLKRYLKGIKIRAERAGIDPEKDLKKAQEIIFFARFLDDSMAVQNISPEKLSALEEFSWMVEEFKVKIFAPELGASKLVSAKQLRKKIKEINELF